MTEFVKTFRESVLIETVNSLLTKIFVAWLQDLDRLDYRDKFVWPRPKRDGVDIYRLEDHFWVWKALKSMEDQEIWSELPLPERSRSSSGYWYKNTEAGRREKQRQENFQQLTTWSNETVSNFDQLYDEFYMITRRIVPTEAQRSIVQRFTTVNDISGERMLATIKAQPYHPANDKSGSQWFTVMRYALSIMMGAKKFSLNTKKASDALRDSCNTLLYFFNHNGFLGEPLSDLAREPVLFDEECDRDSYFHASFEVIYVLFTHAKYLEVPVDAKEVPKTPGQLMTDPKSEMLIHIEETGHRHYRLPTRRMEERIPFSNHMVSSRVCPIEEEWVYNYPEFLSDPGFYLESPINEALRVRIADAKKQKQYGKPRRRKPHWIDHPEFHEFHGTDLLDKLAEARRAQNAKKRCIWLSNPDPESARRFLIASVSDVEKQPLTLFLDHHFQRTKDVHDDTSLALNVWNSEVHLSFHCLCENMPAKDVEGARISDASLPCIRLPGSPTQVLRRAFMSYRFHGDIFDRYWTCHILDTQIMPQTNESDEMRLGLELLLPKEIHRSVFKFADLHKALWQRKVLELVLLMRMLLAISGNTNLIIGHLKGLLSLSRGPQPNTRPGQQGSPRSPSDASALQYQCVDTLNDVESDLTSSLEIIQKWGDRTQSHGDEKPRWTLKDEDKYRRSIRGVQASLDKLTSEIRKQREEVKVLQKRFKSESKQCRTIFVDGQKSKKEAKEKERATRDANSERNIRWFTYVTIVFAPLGFAQGFYSMGGTPSPELVKSLATFSVAALAVTVILLLIGITTFSVLERRRSIMLKIYEARMPQQGLWSLLASTILELITRLIKYPMSVRDDQGGSSMTAIPGVALALAVGILLSPLFVMTWLMQFVAYALGDLYEILSKYLLDPIIHNLHFGDFEILVCKG
ncbi:hypothetical protein N0V93_008923 [Gnomoniopsis smithogilvyi]|uniref:Uncharacterized protein n=1 Tax=Gnomoniopsis smithogilvyi TaxID=1191159 RepID=A0A9W8YM49_9PEZI|nr:hypothetical protein N0V93_008923 [Gnomoniopsis smithogilvyi]